MTVYYHRKTQEYIEEQEVGGKALHFLYKTAFGRLLLKQLIRPGFSNWKASRNNRTASIKKIAPFIEKYQIDLTEATRQEFTSFNDFFTRELTPSARPINENFSAVIAVSDGKVFHYSITEKAEFQIKNSLYTLADLLQDKAAAELFEGGTCLVYRLAMDDYHRYCYPADGKKLAEKKITGKLHTIRPIAHQYTKVFSENTRAWQLLDTKDFGKILYIEIGAMLVGKIHDHGYEKFLKGQEKGFFEYGASSIIVCYQKNQVTIDSDILLQNQNGREVQVRLGEKVGERNVE